MSAGDALSGLQERLADARFEDQIDRGCFFADAMLGDGAKSVVGFCGMAHGGGGARGEDFAAAPAYALMLLAAADACQVDHGDAKAVGLDEG